MSETFERNAKGVREMLSMKFDTLDFEGGWHDAFGTPERRGVWFVWGNSGNGKTSFVMQLCKYLCRFGRVAYNSMEEGACLTMQDTLRRFGMMEVNRRFLLIDAILCFRKQLHHNAFARRAGQRDGNHTVIRRELHSNFFAAHRLLRLVFLQRRNLRFARRVLGLRQRERRGRRKEHAYTANAVAILRFTVF
mgnify:FL=1